MKRHGLLLPSLLLLTACSVPSSTTSTDSSSSSTSSSPSSDVFAGVPLQRKKNDSKYRTFYQIFVSSYADSDQDGIGDLRGICDKLPEIVDMGFDGIWLTPIFSSPSYHKYDTTDYFQVDEDFGTMADLEDLIALCHEKDVRLILDLAINHTSSSHPWFQNALLAHRKKLQGETLTSEEEDYDSLYVFFDSEEEARASGSTYYQAGANSFYYEGNFSSDMPELNFESEFTYEKVEEILDFYLGKGIDGFRLDAVTSYDYKKVQRNVEILDRIAQMGHGKDPDCYFVGETWEAGDVYSQYAQSDIDSCFYFPGSTAYTSTSFLLSGNAMDGMYKKTYLNGLRTMEDLSGESIPASFLDNHDLPRATKGRDKRMTKFQLGLLAFTSGTTFTYYGDEIGMSSSNNPGGDYQDSNYRTHYFWDDESHAYECHDPEHALAQEAYYPSYREQKDDPNSIRNYVRKANLIRSSYPTLLRGKTSTTEKDQRTNEDVSSLLSFLRSDQEETYRVLINYHSYEEVSYVLDEDEEPLTVLLADEEIPATRKDRTLTIPPYSMALIRVQ